MSYYRLYFRRNGPRSASAFAEFDAPGDAEAFDFACHYAAGKTIELWCGDRMVRARSDASPAPEPRPRVA